MLLKLENIHLEFGDKILFNKLNFIFNENNKIGLVGDNGCGKSSLLNIILQKIEFSGSVIFENENYGYLSQDENFNELKLSTSRQKEIEALLLDESIISDTKKYNELLEEYNQLISNSHGQKELALIKKFNFDQELYEKEVKDNLSGGESTKLKLIKLFSQEQDYYLLDEPSNHLDSTSRDILIQELALKKSYLIVSHDVDLLNQSCNFIAEIKNETLHVYTGNYDKFMEFKEKEIEDILKTQTEHAKKKKRLEDNIQSLKSWSANKMREKSKHLKHGQVINDLGFGKGSADSGISDTSKKINKFIDKIDEIETPEIEIEDEIKIKYLDFKKPNQITLHVEKLKKTFDNFTLEVETFEIRSKDKIVVLGDNGCGKSTFLKLIVNELEKESGLIKLGSDVKIGYLSQKNETLNFENTVLDEILTINDSLDEGEIRKYLGKLLFKKNDVFKTIKDLSGGEKIRVAFLKLILSGSNFLILDEPSNHLDIKSKDILSSALNDFPGPILVVSHDNYFMEKFVNRRVEIVDGELKELL
jgi:ATP-binding cassette subfamily F protein 3